MIIQFIFVLQIVYAQILKGRIKMNTLYPHDKQINMIEFPTPFTKTPNIIYSLVGIHINNDIPKNLGFSAAITQGNNKGFTFQVVNENSRIDHLEYTWLAIIDDRIHLACHTLNEDKTIIKYNREFWTYPQIQLFLTGLIKESTTSDLKFSLSSTNIKSNQFEFQLLKQSAHTFKQIQFCYIAGPSSLLKTKTLSNINQKTDEYVDLDDNPSLFYGFARISNFYGVLMAQLGEYEYIEDKPGVGISQIDINFASLKIEEPMSCPIGYFECHYVGEYIDLCEKGDSETWKKIKSIKTTKNWNSQFEIQGKKMLKVSIDSPCINDINSYVQQSELNNQNLIFKQ